MKTVVSLGFILLCLMLALLLPVKAVSKEKEEPQWGVPPAYVGKLLSLVELNIRDAKLEEIISGLDTPRAFEFLNPGEILITEIGAQLKHYDLNTKQLTTIDGLPEIATKHPQTGLIDVEIHPRFADNGRIYLSYTVADEETGKYYMTVVSSAVLKDHHLTGLREILRAEPFGWSPSNFGGAMEFDKDGYLYVTIGDRSEFTHSQLGKRLEGKLLRLNDDGSTPADNPFVNDSEVDDRIYAIGLRNAQGLHFDPIEARLYASEHGPLGGDEVNLIKAGANYGWPTITYGKNYTTESIGIGTHAPGFEQPLFYYLPSEAISPIVMYRGEMFAEWQGDLLVGALKGKHISKLDLDQGVIRSEYPLLNEIKSRIRDLKVAADGSIFVLAQNGKLYRLYRQASDTSGTAQQAPATGEQVYQMSCAGCHDIGAHEAPRLGQLEDWRHILEQTDAQILQKTIDGVGKMPARGLCGICSDAHLQSAIDYMQQQLDTNVE